MEIVVLPDPGTMAIGELLNGIAGIPACNAEAPLKGAMELSRTLHMIAKCDFSHCNEVERLMLYTQLLMKRNQVNAELLKRLKWRNPIGMYVFDKLREKLDIGHMLTDGRPALPDSDGIIRPMSCCERTN